ncbi:MAG: glutamate 5-kinase [Dehalococcoidales bacterium]|jgi:glutamate 5-kinase|nr:glutamate 5-kinase [Dehalococcoidales bacterium]MDD4322081.1 glutamate 5-kinase [Dehalococcoidales bacterium]MDD4793652.1 glutamate 5-kinase [Dehalococcoidales bacterium]MDD5122759.1 glutamate 5-kinase [Dehalococcoidales bacterium]MDD5497865.1 glutamate 5-kinase [Dehalococcoidales bacterium]
MSKNNLKKQRIVIKVGTSLLTSSSPRLDGAAISRLVDQLVDLHNEGYEITLVSSGACAAGKEKTGKVRGFAGVAERQIYASIGQSRLMNVYEKLFGAHKITIAQALLTKHDLSDRSGYLNARNTLMALQDLRIICIVNENDVVAIDEVREEKFGENDILSAMVANLIDADLLLILSDVNGLYSHDPLKYPDKAELIPVVEKIDTRITKLASGSHNKAATGGMITKLEAARLATESGITVIIANGREPDVIKRIAGGESIGTRFLPSTLHKESRQRWLLSGLCIRGSLVIDEGAKKALIEGKRSLLPAGIAKVEGKFKRGDAVNLNDSTGNRFGCGLTNYTSDELKLIKGLHSSRINETLGYDYGTEAVHRNNLTIL